jgi:hypothetical protein
MVEEAEVDCLQRWLAANLDVTNQPLIRTLYRRVEDSTTARRTLKKEKRFLRR